MVKGFSGFNGTLFSAPFPDKRNDIFGDVPYFGGYRK
jgi:hypothetical protein